MRPLDWIISVLAATLLAGLVIGGVLISEGINSQGSDTSFVKTDDSAPDVQEVLPLSVRKQIYIEDWREMERIEEYTITHFPIDLNAPRHIQDQQMRENDKEWNRLYAEYMDRVCEKHGIAVWQYYQILDEGLDKHWYNELE